MSRETDNKARVQAFMEALSRGDTEYTVAAYADEGHVRTMGNTLISGTFTVDQIRAAAGAIFDAFPEGIRFTITGMTAEDDRVAVEAHSEGRHVSGKMYRNEYHFLFRFREDGKLLEMKEYMDTERVTDVLCGGQRPEPIASGG